MTDNNEANPYVPKYISKVPWYQEGKEKGKDAFAHQRQDPNSEPTDYSLAKPGSGITDSFEKTSDGAKLRKVDDYDSKRDRWHGYGNEEWDHLIKNWALIKRKKTKNTPIENDSDDTDYELELMELGVLAKDVRNIVKEDPLEKTIRDRQDIPAYIQNISMGGKIAYKSPSTGAMNPNNGIVNDRGQFVRYLAGDTDAFKRIQQFAWDQNNQYEALKEKEMFRERLQGAVDGSSDVSTHIPVDLNLSMEASPTLMLIKAQEHETEKQRLSDHKKKALADKYGGLDLLRKAVITERVHTKMSTSVDLDTEGLKKSHYAERVYPRDHSSIWGSFYNDGKWGYACCKQTERNVDCKK